MEIAIPAMPRISNTSSLSAYFSIVQRKLLEPNDFQDLAGLARTLNAFEQHWNAIAEPFDWNFTATTSPR
jgi:hypothetical protein